MHADPCSPTSAAPRSPQSGNLRVGSQLSFAIVTAGPEDDARALAPVKAWAIGAGAVGKVLHDDRFDWREAWALFPGDVAYVSHAGLYAGAVLEILAATGIEPRAQIIWAKNNFAIARGNNHWQHERAWYAVHNNGHRVGDRKQTPLWQSPKPRKSETGRSTQKPVECMRQLASSGATFADVIEQRGVTLAGTILPSEIDDGAARSQT